MPPTPYHPLALVVALARIGAIDWTRSNRRNSVACVCDELGCSPAEAERFIAETLAALTLGHFRKIRHDIKGYPDEYAIRRREIGWYVKLALDPGRSKLEILSFHRSLTG